MPPSDKSKKYELVGNISQKGYIQGNSGFINFEARFTLVKYPGKVYKLEAEYFVPSCLMDHIKLSADNGGIYIFIEKDVYSTEYHSHSSDISEAALDVMMYVLDKAVNRLVKKLKYASTKKMDSADIKKLLYNRYTDTRQWVCFEELRLGTGYVENSNHAMGYRERIKQSKNKRPDSETLHSMVESLPGHIDNPQQAIDFYVINMYKSFKYIKIAFEIKTSRVDFIREIKLPEKRQQGMDISNQFYFITPKDMVSANEIPDDCGLMYVDGDKITVAKKAPLHEAKEPNWCFVASICRRIAKKEGKNGK